MRRILKKVLVLGKLYWKEEIIGLILTILYAVTIYFVPKASEYLIDSVIPSNSYRILFTGITLFAGVCLMQSLVGFLKDIIFNRITENITYDIRKTLFHKILYADFDFFDQVKGGNLISIIMNDGRGASDFIAKIFSVLVKNILIIILVLIGMLFISIEITVTVLVFFVVFYLLIMKLSERLREISKNIQMNYDSICTAINQTNNAIITIKSSGTEEDTEKKYHSIIMKMKKDNIRINRLSILIQNLTSTIVILCLAIVYGWGAIKAMQGILTIGQVVGLGLYFQVLEGPFFELSNIGINTNVTIPIFDRIDSYKNLPSEVLGEKEGKLQFEKLRINDVSFQYKGAEQIALKNISLELPNCGIVSITGESGAGKSTFVKILMGMYQIQSGEILFDDKNMKDISLSTLRSNISYVPQTPEILNDTVMNNIQYGVENISVEEIHMLCKRLKIHDKIMSLPMNYDDVITEKVNLSGGEKQRLAIARALLKDTPIIIFDEPLSALDDENSEIVRNIITEESEKRLAIVISHYGYNELDAKVNIMFDGGTVNYREGRN